jgi:hypothetical protein
MATFVKPIGINFRSDNELSSNVLWKSLCLVVSFLQSVDPYKELHWYWDLWEHNGSEESLGHNKQTVDPGSSTTGPRTRARTPLLRF